MDKVQSTYERLRQIANDCDVKFVPMKWTDEVPLWNPFAVSRPDPSTLRMTFLKRRSTGPSGLSQVRQPKKRRGQSDAYHKRIQKKWLRRFGVEPHYIYLDTNLRDFRGVDDETH